MKRSRILQKILLLIVVAVSVSIAFTGCQKVPSVDDSPDTSNASKKPEINARIEIQIEDYNNNNKVQIPKFVSDVQSEALDTLNAEIEPLITVYEEAKRNVLKWPEIFTHTYESDDYLQAVVEYLEMPSLDLDYNIKTFNYDKKNDKALQISDALSMCKYSEAKFGKLVEELYDSCDVGGELKKYEINGFYISKSGVFQFFVRLHVDTGMEEYSLMTTLIPEINKLYTTDENGLYIME